MSDLGHNIERCPHDTENPYSQISRALLQDQNLSFETKGLIVYLLSMKSGWKIGVKHLMKFSKGKAGRDKIYKMLNEAIELGYMKRDYVTPPGSNLRRVVYYLSEFPKFKKCFRREDPQCVADTEVLINKEEELLSSSSLCVRARPSAALRIPTPSGDSELEGKDISPQAKEFLKLFKTYNPSSELKGLEVQKEFDLWLKEKPSLSLQDIQKAAAHAFSQDFWIARIQSLKAFKKSLQTILTQSLNKEIRHEAKEKKTAFQKNKDLAEKVRKLLKESVKSEDPVLKEQRPQMKEILKNLVIDSSCVINLETKDRVDLKLKNHQEFRGKLETAFNLKLDDDV